MENSKVTTYLDLVPRVHRPPGHPPEVPGGLRGGRADVEHAAEGVHPGALRPLLSVAVARGQDDPEDCYFIYWHVSQFGQKHPHYNLG